VKKSCRKKVAEKKLHNFLTKRAGALGMPDLNSLIWGNVNFFISLPFHQYLMKSFQTSTILGGWVGVHMGHIDVMLTSR
jgi:hypothetical protein